jgi:phage terminase large subunit-like protein
VVKSDAAGSRIVKQAHGQKIDLAVAAVMAYDRAINQRPEPRYPITFDELMKMDVRRRSEDEQTRQAHFIGDDDE